MRNILWVIIVLLLVAAVVGIWRREENGRYSIVSDSNAEKIWVLDTRTGEAQLFDTWFHEPRTIRRFQDFQKEKKK